MLGRGIGSGGGGREGVRRGRRAASPAARKTMPNNSTKNTRLRPISGAQSARHGSRRSWRQGHGNASITRRHPSMYRRRIAAPNIFSDVVGGPPGPAKFFTPLRKFRTVFKFTQIILLGCFGGVEIYWAWVCTRMQHRRSGSTSAGPTRPADVLPELSAQHRPSCPELRPDQKC